jgi:DNA-binding NarL/FixJ family response regulator
LLPPRSQWRPLELGVLNMAGRDKRKARLWPARLLVVDDHEMARSGILSMLSGEPGIAVVAVASSGREAIELCAQLHPNLVLMDIRMPEMDGLTATARIKRECPTTAVLIVTLYESADYLLAALKAGAAGYLLKDVSRVDLVSAVKKVLAGESILQGDVAARMLRRLARETRRSHPGPGPALTDRQMQVLQRIAQGKTNREIASDLWITPGTVKVHIERIIDALGVSDRTQAAVRAIELGIISGSWPESDAPLAMANG